MAIELDTDLESDEEQETGKGLRARLEAALESNRSLSEELVGIKSAKILSEKGYHLVKPDDLKGVKPDEIEARAEALQSERQANAVEAARTSLLSKGHSEEEVDARLDELFGAAPAEPRDDPALERMSQARRFDGSVSAPGGPEVKHGVSAIEAALEAKQGKK